MFWIFVESSFVYLMLNKSLIGILNFIYCRMRRLISVVIHQLSSKETVSSWDLLTGPWQVSVHPRRQSHPEICYQVLGRSVVIHGDSLILRSVNRSLACQWSMVIHRHQMWYIYRGRKYCTFTACAVILNPDLNRGQQIISHAYCIVKFLL